jgi:hypothetical protein
MRELQMPTVGRATLLSRSLGIAALRVLLSGCGRPFEGREARHDEEVRRRTQAAIDWLRESFAAAVVVAMHASLLYSPGDPDDVALAPIRATLIALALEFGKPVLLVHGDEHQYIVDRPFLDPATGRPSRISSAS